MGSVRIGNKQTIQDMTQLFFKIETTTCIQALINANLLSRQMKILKKNLLFSNLQLFTIYILNYMHKANKQ